MGGTSRTLSYAYDAGSRRTAVVHPDSDPAGERFTYRWDALGRMTGVRDKATLSATGDWVIRYYYNSAGQRSTAVRGADLHGFTTSHYYDGAGRLTAMHNNPPATANDLSFAYSPASQIASRTRNLDTYAWTEAYDISRSYAKNGLNQYTGTTSTEPDGDQSSATICHDANGNLTSDGTTVYRYDSENRLVEAGAPVSTGCTIAYTGALKAGLKYDPLGRLFETSGGGAGVTRFLYDGDALVAYSRPAPESGAEPVRGAAAGHDLRRDRRDSPSAVPRHGR